MRYLFGTFFLIWLVAVSFRKLPVIWAAFIAVLEFVGESINATPASTTAFDDDDDIQGITSIFDDNYCTTCSNMVCSCHTGLHDDPYRSDDDWLSSSSSSSMFDD